MYKHICILTRIYLDMHTYINIFMYLYIKYASSNTNI
jgi:hypothetical protein